MEWDNQQRILEHFSKIYWEKLNYHREKEYRIFIWTSAILLAGIAALTVSKNDETAIFLRYGFTGKMYASVALIIWIFLSVILQIRERRYGNDYIEVIVRASKLLYGFENGFFDNLESNLSLLPKDWENWTNVLQQERKISRLLTKNFVPVTLLLGGLTLILLWVQ